MISIRLISALLPLILLSSTTLSAQITLPSFFSSEMVLQREMDVPVWGTAEAGAKVTVSFADQKVMTTADDKGAWRVEFKPLKAASKGQVLTVTAGETKVEFKDVLVGDVWVGSGQSNMAGRVASYAKNDATLAALVKEEPYAGIRLMQGGPKPIWKQAIPENINAFSAIHFAFGERLHRELKVPVGLIVGAVGGTPSGYWIPPKTFESSKPIKTDVAEFGKNYDAAKAQEQYEARVALWEKAAAAAKAKGEKFNARKPNPPVAPGGSARGGKVGGLYERYIESVVGYGIRGVLWDQGESGTGVIGVNQHTMMSELIRGWREAWGQGDFPFLFVQKPSGGGPAFSKNDLITRNANPFQKNLPTADQINRQGDTRHLYVRLMTDNPNAWMVPASDLGAGIHPTNKWGYGNRAAEVALQKVYKTDVQAYGPTYKSHKVNGDKLIIEFDNVGKGLATAHAETVQGFALLTETGKWVWADAKIEGNTVVVSSKDVPKPTRVRYGYASKAAWANLFNQDGLPALSIDAGN